MNISPIVLSQQNDHGFANLGVSHNFRLFRVTVRIFHLLLSSRPLISATAGFGAEGKSTLRISFPLSVCHGIKKCPDDRRLLRIPPPLVKILEVAGPRSPSSREWISSRRSSRVTRVQPKNVGEEHFRGSKRWKKKKKRGSPSFKSFIRKYQKTLGLANFWIFPGIRRYIRLRFITPVAPVSRRFHRFTASCSLNKPYCKRSQNPFSIRIEQRERYNKEKAAITISKRRECIYRLTQNFLDSFAITIHSRSRQACKRERKR